MGNLKFIQEKTEIGADMRGQAEKLAEQGKTPLFFARDGQFLGMIAVADVIKKTAHRL